MKTGLFMDPSEFKNTACITVWGKKVIDGQVGPWVKIVVLPLSEEDRQRTSSLFEVYITTEKLYKGKTITHTVDDQPISDPVLKKTVEIVMEDFMEAMCKEYMEGGLRGFFKSKTE